MTILDDASHKKESIDDVIRWLTRAKDQGDTVVKVGYVPCGYDQTMVIETAKE